MSKELKIGIISIIAIASFIWGYNFLKGQNLLDPDTRFFKVEYSKIGGLTKSSSVTINGLRVGKVEDIDFNTDPDKRGELIVRFSVENDFEFSKTSIVKIYSPSPLGNSNLAIIPNYVGEMAVSGDVLPGKIEESLFSSIGERLDPLQAKLERVIVHADTLFSGVNRILSKNTIDGVNSSVKDMATIVSELKTTVFTVNKIFGDNEESLTVTLENVKNISTGLSKVTDSLAIINISEIIKKSEIAIANFNELSEKMNSGNGTIAKLINDGEMYDNLTASTKELELLLRDLKENPKRYVHFSIFGKKQKMYKLEEEK